MPTTDAPVYGRIPYLATRRAFVPEILAPDESAPVQRPDLAAPTKAACIAACVAAFGDTFAVVGSVEMDRVCREHSRARALARAGLTGLIAADIEAHPDLTERGRAVMIFRFGLDGDGGRFRTLEEAGRAFGITRERVRQIEAKACRKLVAARADAPREGATE